MALKFNCENCSSIIYSKFLKIGEGAKCKNCGSVTTIPENAEIRLLNWDGIPNLSEGTRLEILKIFENLGLDNIRDIYKAMDYKLTDEGKPSDDKVPDDWTQENFEGIIDITQQMYLCMNILEEAGQEIRAQKLEASDKLGMPSLKKRRLRKEELRLQELKQLIISLLNEKNYKMPASDIDAHLKHQNVDEIKELCEKMYHNGKISRTANYRYFILAEEKKKPKKTSESKSEAVDVKAELKKYKEMLDEGLITQEDYDAKKKELLGL